MKIFILRFYNYLKQDGVFILCLLVKIMNIVVVFEVVRELWEKFWERELDEFDIKVEKNNNKKFFYVNGVV